MGLTAKAKSSSPSTPTSTSTSQAGWGGMGFLFVLLPEEDDSNSNSNLCNSTAAKRRSFSSPSTSSSTLLFKPLNSFLRRTNSTHLLAKAQSTISICALLIFLTLLLFTLSTFEPSAVASHDRRHQRQNSQFGGSADSPKLSSSRKWRMGFLVNRDYRDKAEKGMIRSSISSSLSSFPHALQGMGTLYRRGTRDVNDLVVAHLTESVTDRELKLFLRLLHRSALTSRSDIVLIFPSRSDSMDAAITGESDTFLRLVQGEIKPNSTSRFDATQFRVSGKKEKESGEPIWGGRRIRSNSTEESVTESTRVSYGSLVGFDVDELDPENSLAGFLDHAPMSLRRWACYPMLLGRVRRNFKHIMLVDVKEILLLGDPLGRVRSKSPESVLISTFPHSPPSKHSRRNSEKTHSTQQTVSNPAIIIGGARGVRRLANAMLTEIARSSMQHKKKNSVSESGLFNQLVSNDHILKNVNLITSTESTPELSSLAELSLKPGSSLSVSKVPLVRRGNSNIDLLDHSDW